MNRLRGLHHRRCRSVDRFSCIFRDAYVDAWHVFSRNQNTVRNSFGHLLRRLGLFLTLLFLSGCAVKPRRTMIFLQDFCLDAI